VIAMPAPSAAPEGSTVRQGGYQVLSLYVWRQDGFAGNISVTGDNLPPGVMVRPQVISATQKQAVIALSAAPDAAAWEGPIRLTATATVNGKELVREVRAATMSWPVPAPQVPAVSRLDRGLTLAVRERGPFSLTAAVDKLAVAPGSQVSIPLKLERFAKDFTGPVQVTAVNLPQGINLQPQ